MSLLSKVFKKAKGLIRKVAPITSLIPGPIGAISMGASAILGPGSKAMRASTAAAAPPTFSVPSTMSMLPALPAITRALPAVGGAAVRVGVAGAKRVYSAAASYCRKHPSWCSTVGGIAAVEAMIGRGELPLPKRRRGRGITATELRNFKRVAKFTSKYCAPVRKAMKAPAMRRGCKTC